MDKTALLAGLDQSFASLEQTMAGIAPDQFTNKPSESGWSAAEIAEHILLLEKIAVKALTGSTVATNRDASSKASLIKWAMEDLTRREAPVIVQPLGEKANANHLMAEIKEERGKLKAVVERSDITEACTGLKHPALGTLTRLEWVQFIIHHTERHRKQMESLKEKLAENIRQASS
jgi:uncharacterized damage-inducible protein DinB